MSFHSKNKAKLIIKIFKGALFFLFITYFSYKITQRHQKHYLLQTEELTNRCRNIILSTCVEGSFHNIWIGLSTSCGTLVKQMWKD